MTKTKKQLRAEAVERLRKLEGKAASYADYCKAMVDCPDGFLGQVAVTQIIDLLTDDDANDYSTPEKVVSGSEPCVTPESCRQYASQRERAESARCGSDSREKLEADAGELTADYAASGEVCDALHGGIIALLDRQAAITEREYGERMASEAMCSNVCAVVCEQRGHIAELQVKVDELTAERDKLQEQLLIGWECECRLQAERERYREKFGKCIDYADAIHALMDDEGMA